MATGEIKRYTDNRIRIEPELDGGMRSVRAFNIDSGSSLKMALYKDENPKNKLIFSAAADAGDDGSKSDDKNVKSDPAPISNPVVLDSEITIRSGAAVREVSDAYWENPPSPATKLYGYVTPTNGPGDSCFQDVLEGARQYGWPIAMVLDCGAQTGSDFVVDCNDSMDLEGGRYLLAWMNQTVRQELKAGLCYFRGNNQTPKAYGDARTFAIQNGIDVSTGLTLVGFIYDGNKFIVQGEALTTSVVRFKARTEQIIKQLNQHRQTTPGLKPRTLSPRKDVFDQNIVKYDYNTNTYNAGDPSRNNAVEIGIWNGNLQKVLEEADAENTPVLIMFGVADCYSHWRTLKSDAFVNWQLSCNMYLSYCYGGWGKGGYSENWLQTNTYQGQASPDGETTTYYCPEYAIHWKPASGAEINIGKFTTSKGDTPTGLVIEPEIIEGFLSGYFSQYQPIDYDQTKIKIDQQQSFAVFGKGAPQRVDNKLSGKMTYNAGVPYKNLDNIKNFCENYDRPLAAIYFNSSANGAGNLVNAFNLGSVSSAGGFDQWLRMDDTAVVWCDVASQDGGKAAAGGEWQTWIADLNSHPERASDRWAFRFYSKQHGVDVSYSFQEIYDKVYDSNSSRAVENMKAFIYETLKPYYDSISEREDTELFIVYYRDFDGVDLIPQQQVRSGSDAIPPETPPSRPGYTFTGYVPSGANVRSDLTCIAQYSASEDSDESDDDSFNGYFVQHTYAPGSYRMRMSNNISAIQVVGDMRGNGMTTQLTSVTFQDNLFQIMPSCFMNCGQLRNVEIKSQTRWIGDYAFYGCGKLESVNALTYPKHTQVNTIGAHAFQNTGLTDIAIDLTASQYGAGVGEFAFAGCTGLKNARFTKSAYIGRQAFDGCTALTSVSLPNSQSYCYPEAFANCASLTSMVIPPKNQTLNNGLFKNCASLKSVEIQDSANERSQLNYIGASVFYGCDQLTSITIPMSISSITQIDPNFLAGSSVREITFNGLSDDVFKTGYTESSIVTVNGYVTTMKQFQTIAQDAVDRNIPVVIITVYNTPETDINKQDCDKCMALAKQLTSQDWQDYMNSVKNKCYFVLASCLRSSNLFSIVSEPKDFSVSENPLRDLYNVSMGSYYAKAIAVYKNSGGKPIYKSTEWSEYDVNPGQLRNYVDQVVSKAGDSIQNESSISAEISKMGSPLSCIIAYSKTGKEYKLSSDSHVETYVPPEVDTVATSDFQTGKWYYNAQELKTYADQRRLPVFAEFSDRYCESCIKFRNEIYERSEFQEWVAKQPYLFCRIETEYFDEFNRMFTQPYFIRTAWAKNAQVTYPGMIFYWNREQNPVWDIVGYGDNPVNYIELQNMIQNKFGS